MEGWWNKKFLNQLFCYVFEKKNASKVGDYVCHFIIIMRFRQRVVSPTSCSVTSYVVDHSKSRKCFTTRKSLMISFTFHEN